MNPEPFQYDDRLPPPAFPPGSGRRHRISPPGTPGSIEQAGPQATGIGTETGVEMVETAERRPSDPLVRHLLKMLEELTNDVARRGEAGLKTAEGMSPFEATLRGYCVGYLAGLRDDEDRDGSQY